MKPVDPMPDEWDCALMKAFARVTKFRGGDWTLAFHDIKQALADGRLPAVVRSLTDSRKWRELPIEFWQTARLSSSGPDQIIVRSKEYPWNEFRFFLRQRDVDKLCPADNQAASAANEALPPWPRKSSAGTKSRHDWELILIKAAGYMYENKPPKSLTELCEYVERHYSGEAPGKTQLETHLDPLYREFKRIDGK